MSINNDYIEFLESVDTVGITVESAAKWIRHDPMLLWRLSQRDLVILATFGIDYYNEHNEVEPLPLRDEFEGGTK